MKSLSATQARHKKLSTFVKTKQIFDTSRIRPQLEEYSNGMSQHAPDLVKRILLLLYREVSHIAGHIV